MRRLPPFRLAALAGAILALPAHALDSCALSDDARCIDAFAGAPILIVTNSLANGPGSLAQAIEDANADPEPNIIGFNLSGACPRTITLGDLTPLPPITDSLSIRGYTQPGATQNSLEAGDDATICIQLRTISGDTVQNGLRFAPTDVADIFDVSGLSIGGFDDAIRIDGGNYTIAGNFIGVDADGVTARTNGYNGIRIAASNAYFATARMIGGSAPAARNLISGNGTGVMLQSGGGNIVHNNFIGTTRSGNTARGNINGIYAASIGNVIERNVVSGNGSTAIRLEGGNGAANAIADNRIGVKALAVCVPQPCVPIDALGNGGDGVRIANGAAGNSIGSNAIAWNDGDGISLPSAGPYNWISANAMHDNGGLAIDLGADGVDANDDDATAPAGAPNRLLNHPVIDSVGGNDAGGVAHGTLQSTNGHYTIEFYADGLPDPTLHGEGRDYLGSGEIDITNAPAGGNGSAAFDRPIGGSNLIGKRISAIARDADGNTSEFGEGRTYAELDVIFANGFD